MRRPLRRVSVYGRFRRDAFVVVGNLVGISVAKLFSERHFHRVPGAALVQAHVCPDAVCALTVFCIRFEQEIAYDCDLIFRHKPRRVAHTGNIDDLGPRPGFVHPLGCC